MHIPTHKFAKHITLGPLCVMEYIEIQLGSEHILGHHATSHQSNGQNNNTRIQQCAHSQISNTYHVGTTAGNGIDWNSLGIWTHMLSPRHITSIQWENQ